MGGIFTSSIGKKLIMSIAGLFLILFLLVHLGINLSLILSPTREAFNKAAHFMSSNLVIRVMEIVLFGGFLLHMFYGVFVQLQNWFSRPKRYKVDNFSQTSFFSKFMIHTAAIISVFLVIHIADFYYKSRIAGSVPEIEYDGKSYHDLGLLIIDKFQMPGFVILYIASFIFLGFHLLHGFQSAFQTLGVNHPVYSPVIKYFGIIYTLIICVGFTAIPVYIYFAL